MIKDKPEVVLEHYPYRYITWGTLENGKFDCRLQKWREPQQRYYDIYLFDNTSQMHTAIEDFEYTKWLDPDGVPCYVKDSVKNLHHNGS